MKVYTEITSAYDFEFWSGAVCRANTLDNDEIEYIFRILADVYPDGMSDTELNDIFWFEEDQIAEWLGYENWEHLEEVKERDCDGKCTYCEEYGCKFCENEPEEDGDEDE